MCLISGEGFGDFPQELPAREPSKWVIDRRIVRFVDLLVTWYVIPYLLIAVLLTKGGWWLETQTTLESLGETLFIWGAWMHGYVYYAALAPFALWFVIELIIRLKSPPCTHCGEGNT